MGAKKLILFLFLFSSLFAHGQTDAVQYFKKDVWFKDTVHFTNGTDSAYLYIYNHKIYVTGTTVIDSIVFVKHGTQTALKSNLNNSGLFSTGGATLTNGYGITGSPYDGTTNQTWRIDTGSTGLATQYDISGLGTVITVTASSPLSSSGGSSPNITIQNSAADGSTKGASGFNANDFNASSGIITIDYTNGQAASSSTKGFLTSSDWTTFNNKENVLTFIAPLVRTSNTVTPDTTDAPGALTTNDQLRNTDSVGTVVRGVWNATEIDTAYTKAVSDVAPGSGISVTTAGKRKIVSATNSGTVTSIATSFPITGGTITTTGTIAADTTDAPGAIVTNDQLRNTDSVGTIVRGTWQGTAIDTTYQNGPSRVIADAPITVTLLGKTAKVSADTSDGNPKLATQYDISLTTAFNSTTASTRTVNPNLGGLVLGKTTVLTTLQEFFYPAQPPLAGLSGGLLLEDTCATGGGGCPTTSVRTLSWSGSRQTNTANLARITVNGTHQSFSQPAAPGTVSGTHNVTTTKNTSQNFSNVVVAVDSLSATATTSYTWTARRYWGRSASATPTEAIIEAGAANGGGEDLVAPNKAKTLSITGNGSQLYYFYAYPQKFGNLSSIIINTFESIGTFNLTVVSVTNARGHTQNYNVYTSQNTFSTDVNNMACN